MMIKWQLKDKLVIEVILDVRARAVCEINFGTGNGSEATETECKEKFGYFINGRPSPDEPRYSDQFAKIRMYHEKLWAAAIYVWGFPVLINKIGN
jgi:hypothetical protein